VIEVKAFLSEVIVGNEKHSSESRSFGNRTTRTRCLTSSRRVILLVFPLGALSAEVALRRLNQQRFGDVSVKLEGVARTFDGFKEQVKRDSPESEQ